jgi:hypothetical protein
MTRGQAFARATLAICSARLIACLADLEPFSKADGIVDRWDI